MKKENNWVECELNAYSYFSAKGYAILIPLVKSYPYDFVAMKDCGDVVRVNVKKAHVHRKNYRINSAGGKSGLARRDECAKEIDLYLTCLPDRCKFMEISGDFFNGYSGSVKNIPVSIVRPL